MEQKGRIFQISASRGGVPKTRLEEALVTEDGLAGDMQADLRAHGGRERALCLFAVEQLAIMQAEGHRLFAGATGENVTIEGIDWARVVPGVLLYLGDEVVAEVTDYTSPCIKNARWFINGNFNRMNQALFPGSSRVYARVVEGGRIREGDPVRLANDNAIDRVVRRQIPAHRWPRDFR
ncbi:MAG: MOSC domain-containing protein [Dehalococcoidia bacterium]